MASVRASRPPGWEGGEARAHLRALGGRVCGRPASRPLQVQRGFHPPEGAGRTLPGPMRTHAGSGPSPSFSPRRIGPETSRRCRGVLTIHGHTPPCTLPPPSYVTCVMGAGVFWTGVALPDTWELGGGRAHLPSLDPPPLRPGLKGLKCSVRAPEAYPPYLRETWKLQPASTGHSCPQTTSASQSGGMVCRVNLPPPHHLSPCQPPRLL